MTRLLAGLLNIFPVAPGGSSGLGMRIRVLGSYGSRVPGHHTSCLLVNGSLLLDAGTISSILSLEEQVAVDDVLLTHAHLDHMVDLAFLVDNVFTLRRTPLRIWAPEPVLETLARHLFNDEVWPDFTRLSLGGVPALEFKPLAVGEMVDVAGLQICAARTNHPVYTVGYCLHEGTSAVLFSGDTSNTEELWQMGRACTDLKAAFVETSFPNRLATLATVSGHLTPALLKGELAKLGRPEVPVKIFHMKPQFCAEIAAELVALKDVDLQVLQGDEEFIF